MAGHDVEQKKRRQRKTRVLFKSRQGKVGHYNKQSKKVNSQMGGKAIGAGTFGCVFRPALRCRGVNHSNKNNRNYVSKLMLKPAAAKEMEIVKYFSGFIKRLDEETQQIHFVLNKTFQCEPEPIHFKNSALKLNYTNTCKRLVEKGYTFDKLQSPYINDFKLINSPYGGIELKIIWRRLTKIRTERDRIEWFVKINTALITMLQNGLLPLNQIGLVHNDVKAENIVYDIHANVAKLIDFGLAYNVRTSADPNVDVDVDVDVDVNTIPRQALSTKSFIYNYTLGNLFVTWGETLNDMDSDSEPIYMANQLLKMALSVKNGGHINHIRRNILLSLGRNPSTSLDTISTKTISNYFLQIFENIKYFDPETGRANFANYFKNVQVTNADRFGFIMSYEECLSEDFLRVMPASLSTSIRELIYEYCYSTRFATIVIPIDEVIERLEILNTLALDSLE